METIYLKTVLPFGGKISHIAAINDKFEIVVSEDQISFEKDIDLLTGRDWYKKEWKAVECTKAEFDAFYIKTVNELNNLIKEL
jgi:hypothetical protein